MARRLYTVANLILEVRQQLDESNTEAVDTDLDILPSLNRGLDYAGSVLARQYPEPFTTFTIIQTVANEEEYELPEDCFEDRILRLEAEANGSYQELRRISFYDIGQFETGQSSSVPIHYAVVGRNIRIVPASTGTYPLRLWYFRQPEELVAPQGRITSINSGSNYVMVDNIGDKLDTESDTLESYVNFVDGQTGKIKGSGQIQLLDNGRITIRSSLIRSDVLNRPISTTLPATLGLDDFVCQINGTCVPEFSQPLSNFLIQFAVAEITRKNGGDAPTEEAILKKFEAQLTSTWSGRENTLRVKRRSAAWGSFAGRRLKWPLTTK